MDFEGLSGREPVGRWNSRSTVTFKLTTDLRRAWVYQDTYVNLRLNPHLPPGTTRQRLVLSWGANQHAEASLGAREWISLPVRRADWTGDRLSTLPISIDLPDGAAPHWLDTPEGRYEERRPLAVVFEELSMTVGPRGRTIAPVAEARRTTP